MAALVAGGIGGGIGYWAADRNDDSTAPRRSPPPQSGGDLKRDPARSRAWPPKALPSTVTIEAEGSNGEGGTGTGFVFDKQGHILTNNHVVAAAADGGKLTATFSERQEVRRRGRRPRPGLRRRGHQAQERRRRDLKPLPLGNSDKVAVGDSTIAIGAPFGLSNTVTTGIISAKNRPVASSDGSGQQAPRT